MCPSSLPMRKYRGWVVEAGPQTTVASSSRLARQERQEQGQMAMYPSGIRLAGLDLVAYRNRLWGAVEIMGRLWLDKGGDLLTHLAQNPNLSLGQKKGYPTQLDTPMGCWEVYWLWWRVPQPKVAR